MQDAHIKYDIRTFHGALLDILSVMNHPLRDIQLLRAADVTLDQILFPLLVSIERFGPIGVVELADRMGRDYTTVSRQIKKLQVQELVGRQSNPHDKRMSEVVITEKGKAMTDQIDQARQQLMNRLFTDWPPEEVHHLFRLVRQYADSLIAARE
ncbi:MarR family transcriptional regulator [Paramixta manurensis]|uniref:MarR family transcriptional regulator n=1 Tax=Paramixta manurensis TaxID=2740817 RepID=A0A6M8UF93_9GAMM|nr:MarR family transcriptional regulator [Erwiniaceae bacterium PD-1]